MRVEDWNQVPGRATEFTCPECRGALQEVDEPGIRRYRCRVGHAYTAEAWMVEKARSVEASLWVALQTLEERARMQEAMAEHERGRGRARLAADLAARATETRTHADRLRGLLAQIPEPPGGAAGTHRAAPPPPAG